MLWNEDTKVQGHQWIGVLSTFVTAYNKVPHGAHNKSPYEAFFGFKMRGVYSTPDEAITETQEDQVGVEAITETQEDQVGVDGTLDETTQEDNEQVRVTQEEKNNDYEIHAMQVERVRREIGQNDQQYRNKMAIRASVHRRKLAFEPGNKVAIASDHDTNQKTRKRKLEQTYSISGEVVSMCSNNRTVRVKVNGEIKTFAAKNLRKLQQN
jgi:hypothetical protein